MQTTKIRRDRLTLTPNAAPFPATGASAKPARDLADLDSRGLFNGRRELKIRHNDDIYRLTITKLGKLILTK